MDGIEFVDGVNSVVWWGRFDNWFACNPRGGSWAFKLSGGCRATRVPGTPGTCVGAPARKGVERHPCRYGLPCLPPCPRCSRSLPRLAPPLCFCPCLTLTQHLTHLLIPARGHSLTLNIGLHTTDATYFATGASYSSERTARAASPSLHSTPSRLFHEATLEVLK